MGNIIIKVIVLPDYNWNDLSIECVTVLRGKIYWCMAANSHLPWVKKSNAFLDRRGRGFIWYFCKCELRNPKVTGSPVDHNVFTLMERTQISLSLLLSQEQTGTFSEATRCTLWGKCPSSRKVKSYFLLLANTEHRFISISLIFSEFFLQESMLFLLICNWVIV